MNTGYPRPVQVAVRKKIRVNINMYLSAANSKIGKGMNDRSFGLPHFAHQSSLTLGLCFACIDILSLTHVLFQMAI